MSNPRTISTQPSHIRDSPTPTQPCIKGFVRRWPKAPPCGASANTPYPFARTFAPPPHCRRVHNTLPTLQDAIRLYSDHYNPLQAKCNLIRGKLRRARSNAPQRFEASSWASCRTTAEASSFCESRAVRHICRTSSTQMSRNRVTFVILPATPRPVPSKKRQRFTTAKYPMSPSSTWRCLSRQTRWLRKGRGAQALDRRGRA